jgi:hypothetical protein
MRRAGRSFSVFGKRTRNEEKEREKLGLPPKTRSKLLPIRVARLLKAPPRTRTTPVEHPYAVALARSGNNAKTFVAMPDNAGLHGLLRMQGLQILRPHDSVLWAINIRYAKKRDGQSEQN